MNRFRHIVLPVVMSLTLVFLGSAGPFGNVLNPLLAKDQEANPGLQSTTPGTKVSPVTGAVIRVPLPLTNKGANAVLARLQTHAQGTQGGQRKVVVLRLGRESANADGLGTRFEDALLLARAMGSPSLRSLRIVGFLEGPVRGHAVLPVLACDQLLVTKHAALGDASVDDRNADRGVEQMYLSIASKRGIFPAPLVRAMVDPELELAWISRIDGTDGFAVGAELDRVRQKGQGWQEQQIASSGQTALLAGNLFRKTRIASHFVSNTTEVADALGLAGLQALDSSLSVQEPTGVLIEINGNIGPRSMRRLESNLAAAANSKQANTWVLSINSPGGSLSDSVRVAGTLAAVDGDSSAGSGLDDPATNQAVGWVESQALGDAALLAVACRPLYMNPKAKLGGSGAQHITADELKGLREAIQQIASDCGRPVALLEALLDPSLQVYRYTDRRTGRIRYATEEQLRFEQEQDDTVLERWQRGERAILENGLSAAEAVQLGLAEGVHDHLRTAVQRIGLTEIPPRLVDRPIVRTVEWIGSMPILSTFLLVVGFLTLSMEMSAPGLGIPGFCSMLCFSLFLWTKFLSGTAEWLEVIAFVLGIVCILLEVLVLPGFGVFGIGGLLLIIAGIVLTSQTFVVPQNPYQYAQLTRSLSNVLLAGGGLIAGLFALRWVLPHTSVASALAMETPDVEQIEQREQLVHYEHLLGQSGTTMTPLRPAGKARFGNELVAVISDGSAVSLGSTVRVVDVKGNHVVVQETDP